MQKYKSYAYHDTETSYSVLESINVEGKEIDITYKNENGNFSDTSLYYYFTDINAYNKNSTENKFAKFVYSKKMNLQLQKINLKHVIELKKIKIINILF